MGDEFLEAAGDGDLAQVQALLPGVAEDERRVLALALAISGGHLGIAKYLLAEGVPPEFSPSARQWSPLHAAVSSDNPPAVALLLEAGVHPEALNYLSRTPFHGARSTAVARLLLDTGADVNGGEETLLHGAAWNGREVLLREILARPGIDVNAKMGNGRTPLHMAAWNENPGCMAALLDAGANACAVDSAGQTPLWDLNQKFFFDADIMVRRSSAHRIVTLLVAAGAREWHWVPTACPGLEAALVPVWKTTPTEHAHRELAQLFRHLEPAVQAALRAALRALHHGARPFGGLPEPLRMAVLEMALK